MREPFTKRKMAQKQKHNAPCGSHSPRCMCGLPTVDSWLACVGAVQWCTQSNLLARAPTRYDSSLLGHRSYDWYTHLQQHTGTSISSDLLSSSYIARQSSIDYQCRKTGLHTTDFRSLGLHICTPILGHQEPKNINCSVNSAIHPATRSHYSTTHIYQTQTVMIRVEANEVPVDGQPFCCGHRYFPPLVVPRRGSSLIIFRRFRRRPDPSSAVTVDLRWCSLRRPHPSSYVH